MISELLTSVSNKVKEEKMITTAIITQSRPLGKVQQPTGKASLKKQATKIFKVPSYASHTYRQNFEREGSTGKLGSKVAINTRQIPPDCYAGPPATAFDKST